MDRTDLRAAAGSRRRSPCRVDVPRSSRQGRCDAGGGPRCWYGMVSNMRAYLAHLAELQSEILLALTYVVVVLPIWSMLRLTRQDLLGADRVGWHRRVQNPDPGAELHLPF